MIHKWWIPDTNYTLQGAEAQPTADRADPLLLRPAWCWQDQHRKVHRSHLGQRVPQDFAWWVELDNLDNKSCIIILQVGWPTSQTYGATEEHILAGSYLIWVNITFPTRTHIAVCLAVLFRGSKLPEWIIQYSYWMRWYLHPSIFLWFVFLLILRVSIDHSSCSDRQNDSRDSRRPWCCPSWGKASWKFGMHIFNFKFCASAKVSMIFSNKYIFIRYSIRNKTQPLLIITLEFPSTLARLANILWLRAKLCITLVSLPPKKIITFKKTKNKGSLHRHCEWPEDSFKVNIVKHNWQFSPR